MALSCCLGLCAALCAQPAEIPPPFDPEAATHIAESFAEENIKQELEKETKIDVIEVPFAEVMRDVARCHEITILLDPVGMDFAGVTPEQLVTVNLKALSLRSSLQNVLGPLKLTAVIRNEVLLVTSLDCDEKQATSRIIPTKKLLEVIGGPEELLIALESAWPKGVRCEPRARIVAGQLMVRGSPQHHEIAEQLVASLYASLDLPPPKKISARNRWVPGKVVCLQNMQVQNHDLELLAGQAQIRELNLAFNSYLHDEGMLVLATLPDLTSLNLSGTNIGESTLSVIAGLRQLEKLGLAETRLGPRTGEILDRLPKLKELNLAGSGLADLKFIAKTPRLESLDVSGNVSLKEDSLAALAALKHLKQLNLRGMPITKRGLEQLAALKSLEQLQIGAPGADCNTLPKRLLEQVPWPHCTQAEVDELQKQLPKCKIVANLTEWRRKQDAAMEDDDDPFGSKEPDAAVPDEEDPFGK